MQAVDEKLKDVQRAQEPEDFGAFMLRAMPVLRATVHVELERKRLFGFPITPPTTVKPDTTS